MGSFKNTIVNDTGFLKLPVGTTEERPLSPTKGMMRYNSTTNKYEHYDGTTWKNWSLVDYDDFFEFLTDTTGTTGAFGFSIRRLNPNYTGFCMKVRRSTDNAITDIGFVNNIVDVQALQTFSQGGNVYVNLMYSQLQSSRFSIIANITANEQPLIVENGNVILFNNRPAIKFTKSNATQLRSANIVNGNIEFTSGLSPSYNIYEGHIVGGIYGSTEINGDNIQYFSSVFTGSSIGHRYYPTTNEIDIALRRTTPIKKVLNSYAIGQPFLVLHRYESSRYRGWFNTQDLGNLDGSTGIYSEPGYIVGSTRTASPYYSDFYLQETVQFNTSKLSLVSTIREKTNNFYQIY